jgi:hypothetical protein
MASASTKGAGAPKGTARTWIAKEKILHFEYERLSGRKKPDHEQQASFLL